MARRRKRRRINKGRVAALLIIILVIAAGIFFCNDKIWKNKLCISEQIHGRIHGKGK